MIATFSQSAGFLETIDSGSVDDDDNDDGDDNHQRPWTCLQIKTINTAIINKTNKLRNQVIGMIFLNCIR